MSRFVRCSPLFALLPTLAIGCQSVAAPQEGFSNDEAAIIGGTDSGPEDDATVLLMEEGIPYCTATVIAPNVLLTALHCVAKTDDDLAFQQIARPESIVVHVGSKRSAQSPTIAAVGVQIISPELAAGAKIVSHDVALVIVQSTDSAFDRLKPRKARTAPMVTGAKVTAVGWGHPNEQAKEAGDALPLQRMRRAGVEILGGSGTTDFISSSFGDVAFGRYNLQGELIAGTAICQGDSGGPAFDDEGAVAGVTSRLSSARGQGCSEGSLSVYTDVSAFGAFIAKGVVEANRYACLSDATCNRDGVGIGRVCDTKTHACVDGCRAGGVACAGPTKCVVPSDVRGVTGTCQSAAPPVVPVEPVDPVDPYTPPPPMAPTPACAKDLDCAASALSPAVCAAGECQPGCRVNAPGLPCGAARVCAASPTDPSVGTCKALPPDEGSALRPPAAPATAPTTPGAPAAATPATPSGASSGAASKDNAAPREKKLDQSGCSVGFRRSTGTHAFIAILALLALARLRRARHQASHSNL